MNVGAAGGAAVVPLATGSSGLLANPWFYALLIALSLVGGAATGIWLEPDRRYQAILLAIGGGSLIVSMAFELYDPAVRHIGKWVASGIFLAGVVTFGTLDILIDRWAENRTAEEGAGLWASVTTDGIPENAAMGSLLGGSVSGALAFLFALGVTNTSQSMMSGANMSENHGNVRTMGAWALTAVAVGGSVLVGYFVLSSFATYWVDVARAFAGGTILASLAGEIYPDAYEQAGPYITLATAVGFIVTFLLL